jgi:hypothetical protein
MDLNFGKSWHETSVTSVLQYAENIIMCSFLDICNVYIIHSQLAQSDPKIINI